MLPFLNNKVSKKQFKIQNRVHQKNREVKSPKSLIKSLYLICEALYFWERVL